MAVYGSNFNYGDSTYKDEYDALSGNIFCFLPNWKYGVELEFLFNTVVSVTRRKREQRKTLYSKAVRKLSFTISDFNKPELIYNYLIYNHADNIQIPLYTEPCKIQGSGSLLNDTVLYTNDISNYYNIQNLTTYILLLSLDNQFQCEIIEVSGVLDNHINLNSPVLTAFNKEITYAFPVFDCYNSKKQRKDLTDKVTELVLEFTENK